MLVETKLQVDYVHDDVGTCIYWFSKPIPP
jgi:hypothetical protein